MSLPAQLWDSVLFFTAYSTSTELRALFADTHDIACVLVCLVCVMADVVSTAYPKIRSLDPSQR